MFFRQRTISVYLMEIDKNPLFFFFFHQCQRKKERFVCISFNIVSGSKFRGKEKRERAVGVKRGKKKKIIMNFKN